VSPKLTRLLLVASVAAGFGILPMPGARADSAVFVYDMPKGFAQQSDSGQCHTTKDPNQMPKIDVDMGSSVQWFMDGGNQGKHNVTPANDVPGGQKWPVGKTNDLGPNEQSPTVKFENPGLYFYYSSVNKDGSDNKGVLDGMCGVIHVIDTSPPTTTPPATQPPATQPPATQPPATTTTRPATPGAPPTTAPAPAGAAGTHPPATAAPTTTTAKADDKNKKNETSTTTTAPALGPTDLPAEAIVPNVSPSGTATQDGVVQPSSTPSGDATAIIKQKHGHGPLILLIVSGVGIGALGIGTGVYKWANRSSKYFPA
jgi:plastocyanin